MTQQALKIMIVDDEEGILDFMDKLLALKGYLTLAVPDGVQAVGTFERERPDITLLDVHLSASAIDGIEVLRKIRDIDKEATCVMVTRITEDETIRQARELGARHYLLKPLDTRDLLTVIDRVAAQLQSERDTADG